MVSGAEEPSSSAPHLPMKWTLWVPAPDIPKWPCVLSWMNMDWPDDVRPRFVRSGANNVKYSWNKVVKDFLDSGDDWLFSCHNDVVFAPATLPRLMSWGEKLVSALIFMRYVPPMPHIWLTYHSGGPYVNRVRDTYEWVVDHKGIGAISFHPIVLNPRPDDALTRVTFTSTSCTLVHRDVLAAMERDWFEWDDDYNGGGEDRRFHEKAALAGFPGYVDRSCIVGHLQDGIPTSAADFVAWANISDFHGTGEPEELTSDHH